MISYIQEKVKNQYATTLKNMLSLSKSGLSSRQEVIIDFNSFSVLMNLQALDLSDHELNEIKILFEEVKNHGENGTNMHGNLLWDKMIEHIDMKVTESNYDRFKKELYLDQYMLREDVRKNIKRLYFLTDSYSLNGRVSEAKETWKLLMMLLKREVPNFKPLPLNSFDGAIPDFS